jgi:hypothetical protein
MDENLFVGKIRSSRNTRQTALTDEEKREVQEDDEFLKLKMMKR